MVSIKYSCHVLSLIHAFIEIHSAKCIDFLFHIAKIILLYLDNVIIFDVKQKINIFGCDQKQLENCRIDVEHCIIHISINTISDRKFHPVLCRYTYNVIVNSYYPSKHPQEGVKAQYGYYNNTSSYVYCVYISVMLIIIMIKLTHRSKSSHLFLSIYLYNIIQVEKALCVCVCVQTLKCRA